MRTDNPLGTTRPSSRVTWDDLFERAAAYDVSEDDVRAALTAVRDGNE